MYPNKPFSQIVESYRSYLRSNPVEVMSFSSHCLPYGIRLSSILQWMRRHGMSVASLQLEILLEKTSFEASAGPIVADDLLRDLPFRRKNSPRLGIEPERLLKGVNLTFPDGVVLTVRETTPEALCRLTELYHQSNLRVCSR